MLQCDDMTVNQGSEGHYQSPDVIRSGHNTNHLLTTPETQISSDKEILLFVSFSKLSISIVLVILVGI